MPPTPHTLLANFWSILHAQTSWAEATFGPGLRTKGLVKHIRSELDEIEADPESVEEWVDVLVLAFDGARRVAGGPGPVLRAYIDKMIKNFARTWPDYRLSPNAEDNAFMHINPVSEKESS